MSEPTTAEAILAAVFDALDGKTGAFEYAHTKRDQPLTVGGIMSFLDEFNDPKPEPAWRDKSWEERTVAERYESMRFSAQHALIKKLADLRKAYDELPTAEPIPASTEWVEQVNRALFRYDQEPSFGVREVAAMLSEPLPEPTPTDFLDWLSLQKIPMVGDAFSLPKLEAQLRAAWNAAYHAAQVRDRASDPVKRAFQIGREIASINQAINEAKIEHGNHRMTTGFDADFFDTPVFVALSTHRDALRSELLDLEFVS